jgi:hypothetical protein
MIIRDDQIQACERSLFVTMQQRVERAVAATFPEYRETPKELRTDERGVGERPSLKSMVARGIESAVRFDVQDGPDIAVFIALGLALRLWPPGEPGSWIQACLNRPETSGPTKLRMIESRLRPLARGNGSLGLIAQRVAQARDEMAK